MLMTLGLYVFVVRTLPYEKLDVKRQWRHVANNRFNRRPSTQFIGPDNDTITLSGTLLPEITGGLLSLTALELMAEQGRAWPLIEGTGMIYGMFVIESLQQTKSDFFADGSPRSITFTLSLKRVDGSLWEMFGDLASQAENYWSDARSAVSKLKGGLLG